MPEISESPLSLEELAQLYDLIERAAESTHCWAGFTEARCVVTNEIKTLLFSSWDDQRRA